MGEKTTNGEIEISPEMIEAGIAVLLSHCPDTATGDNLDCEMIAEIYSEIVMARMELE